MDPKPSQEVFVCSLRVVVGPWILVQYYIVAVIYYPVIVQAIIYLETPLEPHSGPFITVLILNQFRVIPLKMNWFRSVKVGLDLKGIGLSLCSQVCCQVLQRCSASVPEALLHQWGVFLGPVWAQEDEATPPCHSSRATVLWDWSACVSQLLTSDVMVRGCVAALTGSFPCFFVFISFLNHTNPGVPIMDMLFIIGGVEQLLPLF